MWLDDTRRRTVKFARSNPWRYAMYLWMPLLIGVVFFKVIKYALLTNTVKVVTDLVDGSFGIVLYEHGLIALLILVLGVVSGLLIQSRFAHLGALLLPATVITGLLAALAVKSVLVNPPAWISLDFVEVIRWDVFFTVLLVFTTAILLAISRGLLLKLVLIALHLSALLIFVVVCFDFGYFVETGSLADSYLLWYSILNFTDLRHAVVGELDASKIFVLLVPILVTLLPLWAANRKGSLREVHLASYSWRMKRGIATTAVLLAAIWFVPPKLIGDSARLLSKSTLSALFGDLSSIISSGNDAASGSPNSEIVWPADALKFEVTDSSRTPNVVIVVLESARATFGQGVEFADVMPFVDSLGSTSISVEDMSVVVPHTNKALVPILCGVYPELSQGPSVNVAPSCLPSLLGDLGYESSFFTAASLDFERKDLLLDDMGFDEKFGDGSYNATGFSKVNYFGYEDNIMLETGLDWIRQRVDSDTPFIASFLTLTAHHDYGKPGQWVQQQLTAGDDKNRYLNALQYQDAFAKTLFESFKSEGWLDNTIFVVIGDHGEAFAEHGLRFHSAVVYQEVAHVPLVIYSQGLPARVVGPRQQIDLVPTLAELMDLQIVGGELPGSSVLSAPDSTRTLFMAGWVENQSMALRRGNIKYVYHFRRRPMQMFDLSVDREEKNDLGGSLEPDAVQQLEREILDWRTNVNRQYAE